MIPAATVLVKGGAHHIMSAALDVNSTHHFLKLVGVGILAGIALVVINAYITAPAERAVGLAA